MLTKFTELVQAIEHALHISKPLLFEMTMFVFGAYEMGKFIWGMVTGHGG